MYCVCVTACFSVIFIPNSAPCCSPAVTVGQPCENLVVRVQIPPIPLDRRGNAKVGFGVNLAVFCLCNDSDENTITRPEWTRNEQTVSMDTNQNRHFLHLARTSIAVLRIVSFSLDDIGTYTCVDSGVKASLTLVAEDADTSVGELTPPTVQ